MLRRRAIFSVAIPVFLAACASGPPPEPPAPPPLDPTGTWDMMIDMGGQSIEAVLTISGSAEAGYTGYIDADVGSAGVANIAVDGQTLTFGIPDIDGIVTLVVEGGDFTGSMNGMMGEGMVSGMRRAGG